MKHIVTLSLFLLSFTCRAQVKFSELPMAPTINSSTKFVGLNTVSTTNTVYRYNIADMITYFNAHGGGTLTNITQAYGILCTPNPITGTGTVKADTGTLFTSLLTTISNGYGISIGSRIITVDTGTLFTKYSTTLAAGYSLSFANRTYKVDTGFGKVSTQANVKKVGDSVAALITSGAVYQYTTATSFTGTVTVTSANSARSVKFFITAQAGNLLVQNFAGSLTDGQFFTLAIGDNGAGPWVVTWGTQFTGSVSTTLPAATIPGSTFYCGFIYRSSGPKIHLVAYSED